LFVNGSSVDQVLLPALSGVVKTNEYDR